MAASEVTASIKIIKCFCMCFGNGVKNEILFIDTRGYKDSHIYLLFCLFFICPRMQTKVYIFTRSAKRKIKFCTIKTVIERIKSETKKKKNELRL